MNKPNEEVELLRQDCYDDEVGLWEIVRSAKRSFDSGLLKPDTLEIVKKLLLSDKQVRAGCWNENGCFVLWEGTPDEIVERISMEWDALDHVPNIGDVVYFTCPAARNLPMADEVGSSLC